MFSGYHTWAADLRNLSHVWLLGSSLQDPKIWEQFPPAGCHAPVSPYFTSAHPGLFLGSMVPAWAQGWKNYCCSKRYQIAISAFQLTKAVFLGEGITFRAIFFTDFYMVRQTEVIKRNVSRNNLDVFSMVRMGVELLQRIFLKVCGFSLVDPRTRQRNQKKKTMFLGMRGALQDASRLGS